MLYLHGVIESAGGCTMIGDVHIRIALGEMVYQTVEHLEHCRALPRVGGRIPWGDKGDADG